MSEPNLSRRVAQAVVDALKTSGHIVVVKGRADALVRELDTLMAAQLAEVSPAVGPRAVVGEVTSTFGNEAIDETIEEMVADLAKALMDSDHVEDVFAEDNVIRRDVFRAVRDALLTGAPVEPEEEEVGVGPISVRLDTLGYVASTVARRADETLLREALERAAEAADAELASYDRQGREALFHIEGGDPDARLEIEEAIADELTDLVDVGAVDLPKSVHRFELMRAVAPSERATLAGVLEAVAGRTVLRAGYASTWQLVDERTVEMALTPMSEKDARDVEQHATAFAREVNAALGEMTPPASSNGAPSSKGAPASRRSGSTVGADTGAASTEEAPPPSSRAPASSRRGAPAPPPSRRAGGAQRGSEDADDTAPPRAVAAAREQVTKPRAKKTATPTKKATAKRVAPAAKKTPARKPAAKRSVASPSRGAKSTSRKKV